MGQRNTVLKRVTLLPRLDSNLRLGKPHPGDIIEKPADLHLSNLVHFSANCVANYEVCAEWSQEPMLRFVRRVRHVENHGAKKFTGKIYRDTIRFNDWAFRRFELKPGMKMAIFADRLISPRYFVLQNVVRSYEAPAHLHRLGTFTLRRYSRNDPAHQHLCKPETRTELGFIGHDVYSRHPLSLFEHFPKLNNHLMRLWRMVNEPDTIIGLFADVYRVPAKLKDKLTRVSVGLLESEHRPYDPQIDQVEETLEQLSKYARRK